jgi:beta-xylosidase
MRRGAIFTLAIVYAMPYRSLVSLQVLFAFSTVLCAQPAQQPPAYPRVDSGQAAPWVADLGDGRYRNPVLYADYSDPDAIRVREDYYLTASSFSCVPGLPVLKSKDLVNWKLIGYALPRLYPDEVYVHTQPGDGVWAPAIRYHNRLFYIYYPDPDFGIYVVTAKDPAGPWSKPMLVVGGKGLIDPCPLFDDDGKVWLVNGWAASRAEVNSLLTIRALDATGTKVTGEGHMVFDGHDDQPTIEGPKLYKRKGYYYIFAPAGGVTHGWQLVLRSRKIYGPYEKKIVMDQGATAVNGPHQGAWVTAPDGEAWFLHFQDKGAYGRIVHLEPMRWSNDWPIIGQDPDGDGKGEPVATYRKPAAAGHRAAWSIPCSDEFNGSEPGLQWQWEANPAITWSAEIPGSGMLRLFAIRQPTGAKNLWATPNLLLQKFPAPDFVATTKMRLTATQSGKRAGLLIMGSDYAYLSLTRTDTGYLLEQVVCKNADGGKEEKVVARHPLSDAGAAARPPQATGSAAIAAAASSYIYFRVRVTAPDASCLFSYSIDGRTFIGIGDAFTAKPGRWIGAKLGIFCNSPADAKTGGYADFDWFHVEAPAR